MTRSLLPSDSAGNPASDPDALRPGPRIRFLTGLILSLWLVVAGRLVHVQWYEAAKLTRVAARQRHFDITVPARPADIVDRNGRVLATSIVASSLAVDPTKLDAPPGFIDRLASILQLDPVALSQRIDTARRERRRFLWIRRRMDDDRFQQVAALDWPDGACLFRDEFLRQYPQSELAAHVLGLRDIDGEPHGGVEQSLDGLIRGRPGRRRVVRDALGRIVNVSFDTASEPQRLDAVELTIDLTIQAFAEKELDGVVDEWQPRAACAIVLDPRTGEVLAMASRPTYDPGCPETIPADAWKNQAISIIYEPGSTFKPFVIAWALQQGLIQRDEVFHCEHGEYRMGGRTLHDHHPYGPLSVTDVLVKSSNIGMAKIGERLTNAGLYTAAVTFGFGRPTGIELPGELPGLLRPLKDWNGYSTGSIPMGQELAVTPLQLITAHAALANGGRLISPRIFRGVHGQSSGRDVTVPVSTTGPPPLIPATVVTGTVDPGIARWLVEQPLTQVVSRGTGRRAELPAWTVFGKTGTAQKTDPETGAYSQTRYVSSFLCGAPSTDPRVLVLVVVDEPRSGGTHFGGTIAAPAASRILHRALVHLRVPADRDARSAARIAERLREELPEEELF